mgnify:CR=1 FL=1
MGTDLEAGPEVWQPAMAKELCTMLALDGAKALSTLAPPGVVCWAPAEPSAIGRLMAACIQHAATDPHPRSLRLIVALDTLPGCSTTDAITDLWSHPLLQDKWKSVVTQVQFTSQALEIIQAGPTAPLTATKTFHRQHLQDPESAR